VKAEAEAEAGQEADEKEGGFLRMLGTRNQCASIYWLQQAC
jgi:hypothetical protein